MNRASRPWLDGCIWINLAESVRRIYFGTKFKALLMQAQTMQSHLSLEEIEWFYPSPRTIKSFFDSLLKIAQMLSWIRVNDWFIATPWCFLADFFTLAHKVTKINSNWQINLKNWGWVIFLHLWSPGAWKFTSILHHRLARKKSWYTISALVDNA